MPTVIRSGQFRVTVYANDTDQHSLAHCHVSWTNGRASVDVETLQVIKGARLPRQGRDLLAANRDLLIDTWNRLNPERKVKP